MEQEVEWRQKEIKISVAKDWERKRGEGKNEKDRRVVNGKFRQKRESRQKGEPRSKREE